MCATASAVQSDADSERDRIVRIESVCEVDHLRWWRKCA